MKKSQVNTKNNNQKKQLSKEDINSIKRRMSQMRKENTDRKASTQALIPYKTMLPDGTCHIGGKKYSQTVEFYDTNYQLATFDEKGSKFSSWCDILNYFDDSIEFQNTYENQIIDKDSMIKYVKINDVNDSYNDIRKEYSNIRIENLFGGNNGRSIKKYLTFTTEAKNLREARAKLNTVANEVIQLFADMKVSARKLSGEERLESMYKSLNPFTTQPFLFDWNLVRKGYDTKDFIAPSSVKFVGKNQFEIGNAYGCVTSINILAGELSDRIIADFLDKTEGLVSLNFHIKPFDQIKALKYVRGKLSDVQKMKIDEQKKAFQAGYDSDILPESIQIYLNELKGLLEDLNSKNERLFDITITVRQYALSKQKSNLQLETLSRITQKNNCKLISLDYMQEEALASSLPIGYNDVPIARSLPTSAVAVFIPFSTQEVFQAGGTYYGLNQVTKNMILADRLKLKNPNGLYLGVPGGGKSFAVKREITDIFLTRDDDIFITDPEGEYYPIVQHLKGQIVKISSNSPHHINPLDININAANLQDENPVATKSDFIISLCELIVSDKLGLTAEERSAIDKCTKRLYQRFFSNSPSRENMPTLADLQKEFRAADVVHTLNRVANSLEMYVTGSQNIFAYRTNVDIDNRLVCFDIKELGSQLKKIAQLIIQDQVWCKVSENRNIKTTRYYIDEFHLLLRDEQTAKYSVEMWKRFRKWGGVPTGITQNVKDLLSSPEIANILDNSDFIYMLSQANGDRKILQEKLDISDAQIKYVKGSQPGHGLVFYGDIILPFEDDFPENTIMFQLLNTDPAKRKIPANLN